MVSDSKIYIWELKTRIKRHPVPSRETIRRRLTEVGLRSRRVLQFLGTHVLVLRHFEACVDDILTPIVLPMLSSRPGAIYQQDNARPHTARLSQQCLQNEPWPPGHQIFRQ
ncbi:hypothetical protein TNCV_2642391 [Trichonephila clavipes]|nr:hypothetical protein TNCV_2642391 [Trichonephila clavipes]